MTIHELRSDLEHKVKSLQDVERFIKKAEFKLFYDSFTEVQKLAIQSAIYGGNVFYLKERYSKWFFEHFGYTGIKHLRQMAKQLGILYYVSKSKDQLLKEIYHATTSP